MSEAEEQQSEQPTQDSALTTVARSLGGSAALGLLSAVVAPLSAVPAAATVTFGAVVGLIGGYLIKNLDKH